MMRRHGLRPGGWVVPLLACIFLVSSSHGASPPQKTPDDLPAIVASSGPGAPPLWISGGEALEAGHPRSELFTEFHRNRLLEEVRGLREARERGGDHRVFPEASVHQEDCPSYSMSAGKSPYLEGREAGLESLFDWAEVVVLGRVTGREEGFFGGFPSSLYRLRIEEVPKAPDGIDLPTFAFFDYPLASLVVDGEPLCVRPRTYPKVPERGRRVLVLAQGVLSRDPLVLRAGSALVVFEDEQGEVVLPWLDGEIVAGPDWSHVEERIRSISDRAVER